MLSVRVVSLVAVVVSVLMAATPIATVVSGEGLKVRGTAVPPTSVSSFPVVNGDELAAGASPAVVMFKDQSRLTLSANSRVKLEQRKGNTCIFLLDGSINLNAVAGAKVAVCAPGRSLVAQTPFEGQITLDANTFKVAPVRGALTEGKSVCSESPIFAAMGGRTAAIVILTAAAAGGTAAGIALTRGDDAPQSPIR
jgi:hypothetical protein